MMNRQQRRATGYGVHRLVADTAKEIAGSAFEQLAKNDEFYAVCKNQERFIQLSWQYYVPLAREYLTDLLTAPSTTDYVREQIFEGLLRDGSLNPPIRHAKEEAARLQLN
jgi:hypothetical protein